MESLPKSLLYMTSQISNFTRNIIKVNSLNQTTLSSNGVSQIRLALPVNAVLNMKSLAMHGVVTTSNNGTPGVDHVLIPKGGIGALLDRVTWSAGGVSLDNGPVPYHVIYAIKENLEKGHQKSQSDDRVLQQSEIQGKGEYAVGQGQKKKLVQNNFLGFTECHPTYLDMSLLPECFCTIQVASASVCPLEPAEGTLGDKATNAGSPQFSINDIFFTVEVCQIGSGMYDALTQRLLQERGSIDVPYPQYQVFSQTGQDFGSTSIRGSISCMSLDRMYVVARNNASALDETSGVGGWALSQAPIRCENPIGNCFQQQSVNFAAYDLGNWQFTLNNAPMPMYRADPVDAFNFAVCAEDRSYSKDRGCQVSSQKEWLNNKWCATQRLCLDNDPTRLSGTNLSSINAQIVFTGAKKSAEDGLPTPALPDAGGIQLMLVTQQTSVLRIGQSRACAVVA